MNMGRHSCGVKQKLRKGLWSPEEDDKLFNYITRFGVGCWSSVPKLAGLSRCGKSCRLRWINYLRPDLKRGVFSQQEEDLIISLHKVFGNRWAQIAARLPGRTDNEIKNLWNSSLKKKLLKQGIDPATHNPLTKNEGQDKKCNDNSKSQQWITNHSNGAPTTSRDPTFLVDDPIVFNHQTNIFDLDTILMHDHNQHIPEMCSNFGSISSTIKFKNVNGPEFSDNYSDSRISWESSSNNSSNNLGENGGFWSDFKSGSWQEQQFQTSNLVDFSCCPMTSLSEDLILMSSTRYEL